MNAVNAEAKIPDTEIRSAGLGAPGGDLPFRGNSLLGLLLITLLAIVLRLWQLGDWSIWVDEAHTWRDITLPLDSFLDSERAWYPLSFLGLRALVESHVLPSLDAYWLRLPFAIFGMASVPLLAWYGRSLVGRRAALTAALFLAVNPWHIYFSQNARGYVLVAFFAILSAGCYWQSIQRGQVWLRVIALGLAVLTGACHITGLALLPIFIAFPVLSHWQRTGHRVWIWLIALGGIGIVLPIIIRFFPPFLSFQRAKSEASIMHFVHTSLFYFRPSMLCAALAGVWLMIRTRMHGRGLFLLCWLLVPMFAVGVLGSTFVKATARYAFCALPALMLLAASASVRLGESLVAGLSYRSVRSRIVPILVLPMILFLDMASYDYLYFTSQHGDRARWGESAALIQQAAKGQPYLVYSINEPSLQYYLCPDHFRAQKQAPKPTGTVVGIHDWELARGYPSQLKNADGSLPPGALSSGGCRSYFAAVEQDAVQHKRAAFFVITLPEIHEKDPSGVLLKQLQEECRLLQVLPCWVGPKDETIYIFSLSRR